MARRGSSPELIGRRHELEQLEAALARATGGRTSAVLVGGESGVGKTRLVEEFLTRAQERGAVAVSGECVKLGEGELPYAPVVGALRRLRHTLDRDELDRVLGTARPEIAPLVPELAGDDGERPRGGPPEQALLFEQLLGILGRLAERAPAVLVIEDLHWADRSTRDFLTFLLRNARSERLLVVATYRTEELHRRHPLRPFLAEAERAAAVERLVLEPFTRDELTALLSVLLGHPPASSLVAELFARAEGNVFFTEQLLAATGGDRTRRLPDSIRDALLLRVETLADETQHVLRVAAAAGPRVTHRLLAAACPVPADELHAGLREALAHNVLEPDATGEAYAFRHVLLREVLYEELLPGERAPLHRALAAALRDDPTLSVASGGAGAELAFHFFAARDLPAALAASLRAGADAERMTAYPEAAAHFERALEVWDGVPEAERPAGVAVVDVLQRAAEVLHLTGDHERAAALAARASALSGGDASEAAPLAARRARYLFRSGQVDEALTTLRDVEARLPAGRPIAARAVLLEMEANVHLLTGRMDEAQRCARDGLEIVRAVGPQALESSLLASLGGARVFHGDAGGIDDLRRARELAERLGDEESLVRSYINEAEALDQLGRTAEGAEVGMEAVRRRAGARFALAIAAGDAVTRLVKLGRWDEAERFLETAGVPIAGITGSALIEARATMALLRGDQARAERLLGEAAHILGDVRSLMWQGPVAERLAEAALWRGEPEAAVAHLAPALADAEAEGILFWLTPLVVVAARAHAELAIGARALRDDTRAAQEAAEVAALVGMLRERAARTPFTPRESALHIEVCAAEAARARGEDTADLWAALAARCDDLPRPYLGAYLRWRAAEAALAAGDRAGAQAAVVEAHAVAGELRAAPLLGELERFAQRARLRLGGDGAPASDGATTAERIGLTPREADVLRLVAAGRTNKEIAAELFMSDKTASVHVSRILTKLEVRGRVEAAGVAHRLGLG